MLGREPRRFGVIDWRRDAASTRRRCSRDLNLDIDPGSLLASHSMAVQQLVAIGRAIDVNAEVLVLDEPTSSLDVQEVAELIGGDPVRSGTRGRGAVRRALPGPGLPDHRPHHRAAQRRARRRVPHRRTAPAAAGVQDDRQGPRRPRGPGGRDQARAPIRIEAGALPRGERPRPQAGPSSRSTSRCTRRGRRIGRAARLRAHRDSCDCCTAPTAATRGTTSVDGHEVTLRSPAVGARTTRSRSPRRTAGPRG